MAGMYTAYINKIESLFGRRCAAYVYKFVFCTMDFMIHETAVVDEGASIGPGSKIWHFSHIMAGAKIGGGCTVGQNVYIGGSVIIGKGVKIQNNVSVYDGVTMEDNVFVGPSVVFTNIKNPRSFIDRKAAFQDTLIREGASIGANATIICGVEIGRFALIGAGAVVASDVPDFSLVVGNPATSIGWVSREGERLYFDTEGIAVSGNPEQRYVLNNGKVFVI